MQLVFDFSQWLISPRQGVVGRQYDNLSHSLVVEGELPSGYTWDMLVEAKGKYNIIPLSATATGATASLTADQLAFGDTYYAFQLRGTSGEIIHHTNAVQVYVPDTIVGPGTWPVLPTEFSQAEANIKELNAHPPVPGENGYWMLWDLDTHSYVQSQLVVPGLHIEIGETTTGEPGTPASVTNSGTNTAPVLNFTIPEGEKGNAATIQVGTVTASDPGSEPQVKNSGTENAAVFDFVLPRGQTGPTGQAATIEVESTVTGEPGTQASVENVGTTGAAKLKFTIPRGNTGQNGVTPTLSAGNVETLEPDQPATASVTGEGPAYQINLGIPRGKTGAQGAPGQNGQDGQTPTIAVGTVTTLDPGQDATAEITGETPNLTLNLGIPEGQPGQDGVQFNDDAINTTEAWSSKKIVDTLCPAFSVSGNPVTCHPVEGYPISAVVTLEPKQAGSGDPSPENVRPISGYDEVTVNVRGKNVVNVDDIPEAAVTEGGHYFETLLPFKPYLGATVTLSANVTCLPETYTYGWRLELGAGNTTYQYDIKLADTFTKEQGARISVTGTVNQDAANYEWLAFRCRTEIPTPGVTFEIANIMLEVSDTPTPYEPYQPGTTATITLPETIYGGTVDAVTGVGSEETIMFEMAIADMNNDENFPGWIAVPYLTDIVGAGYNSGINDEILKTCNIVKSAFNDTNISYIAINTMGTNSVLYLSKNTFGLTQTQWKEQYPDLVVQICLKRISPESFQATGNQALPAVAGLNTVYTDGDSLAVSGRQDLLYTLQTMQAQTQNLNRFIAEGGTQ